MSIKAVIIGSARGGGAGLSVAEWFTGHVGHRPDIDLDVVDVAEWQAKPIGFVSYGGLSGGLRAVEQLRQVFAELHAMTVRDSVSLHGPTKRSDLTHAQISIGEYKPSAQFPAGRC